MYLTRKDVYMSKQLCAPTLAHQNALNQSMRNQSQKIVMRMMIPSC